MPVILDSGAFAVFNRGETIDLNEYIRFCLDHPRCTYYVNLDQMPGKGGAIENALTDKDLNTAAETSWHNLQRMAEEIPKEKLITVFHQNENFEYLIKMIEENYSYIGLSFAAYRQSGTDNKIQWLNKCKAIFNKHKILPKVHGFGITAFPILKAFPWHSVDSATWVLMGGRGLIYVPVEIKGEFDFAQAPFQLSVSDTSPITTGQNKTWTEMAPTFKTCVEKWLDTNQIPTGEWKRRTVEKGYKLERGKERWWKPEKELVNQGRGFGLVDIPEEGKCIVYVEKKGLRTDDQYRKLINARFYFKVNEALPIKYIYLAGLGIKKNIDREIQNRLLSYADARNSKEAQESLAWHMENTHADTSQ